MNGIWNVSYNPNGDMLNAGGIQFGWDLRHRLTQISGVVNASFAYDTFGRRISKTIGGITTSFLYDGDNPIQETRGGTVTTLLTGLGIDERFARDDAAYGRTYFLTDALGSTLALTDASGAVRQTYAYEPYGEVASSGDSDNPYQYTGRENDGSGLYYYRARYYSPRMKRFIAEDPMGLAAGLNTYAYVNGNPINWRDPSGHQSVINCALGNSMDCVNIPPEWWLPEPESQRKYRECLARKFRELVVETIIKKILLKPAVGLAAAAAPPPLDLGIAFTYTYLEEKGYIEYVEYAETVEHVANLPDDCGCD